MSNVTNKSLGRESHFVAFVLGGLAIGSICIFAAVYVAAEQPAYFWDYGNYFNMFRMLIELLEKPGREWHNSFWWGIHHDDYNASSLALLMPFGYLFGSSRTTYVVTLVALYLAPAALLMARVAIATAGLQPNDMETKYLRWSAVFCSFVSWPLWIATLRGMPDIVGLMPLMIATLLLLRSRFLYEASYIEAASIGFSLWAAFLLRRWYAYTCLSVLVLSVLFCGMLLILEGHASSFKKLKAVSLRYMVLTVALVMPLLIVQGPLTYKILTTNYSDIYKMYQHPLPAEISFVYRIFGPVVSVMAAGGSIYALVCRNTKVIFCSCVSLLTFVIFIRTQSPGEQHIIPFYAFMFPAFMWAFVGIDRLLRTYSSWSRVMLVVPIVMLASFSFVFWPNANIALGGIKFLFPSWTVFPLQIQNYAAYLELMRTLERLAGPAKKIIVLASTEDLSGTTIDALDYRLSKHVLPVSEVDARDGLNTSALAADIAVVSDPPAVESPSFQHVVSLPDTMILEGRDYGAAFTRVAGPIVLAHGLKVFVYDRTRSMTDADVASLRAGIQRYYPLGLQMLGAR